MLSQKNPTQYFKKAAMSKSSQQIVKIDTCNHLERLVEDLNRLWEMNFSDVQKELSVE